MVTPRRTRLFRAATLHVFQQTIADTLRDDVGGQARDWAVLVPTRAAAEQLQRTLGAAAAAHAAPADRPPQLLTRDEWYERLHGRLGGAPRLLSRLEREVIALAAARDVEAAGVSAPFKLRPGLVAAMLAFYDELMRHGRTVAAFERLVVDDLEPSAEVDRGARRLLRQTRFLVAAFRAYRKRVEHAGRLDEHALRRRLLDTDTVRPFTRVVVTIPDRPAHPGGLWPADFDLLARLPRLAEVDLIATNAVLDAGYRTRLDDLLPAIEEARRDGQSDRRPVLVTPPADSARDYFVWRDREEELKEIARRVRRRAPPGAPEAPRPAPDAVGVVFQRPLPYLYLAPPIFDACAVPVQARDALPLATEPYAAAVDLVFTLVSSALSRSSIVALLRSPHFAFTADGQPLEPRSIAALDRVLQERRFAGGRDALTALVEERAADRPPQNGDRVPSELPAAVCAVRLADELGPLAGRAPAAQLLDTLLSFLRRHAAPLAPDDPLADRESRARDAIWGAIADLRHADAALNEPGAETDFGHVTSVVRRWMEGQTFARRGPAGGVQLLDARAAPYGRFDDVFLVGLIDGEWPDRPTRNIFYPPGLLVQLGWPRERDRARAARAAFRDLVELARERVTLSTCRLEDDAVVTPSTIVEDVAEIGLERAPAEEASDAHASDDDALSDAHHDPPELTGPRGAWLALRRARRPRDDHRFHGFVGPRAGRRYAVSALERYLDCPFKYFARHVLALEEERDDERTLTAQERGRFLHRVFETFFTRWQADGEGAITLANLDAALDRFRTVAEEALLRLAPSDRAVARTWLLGSAASAGLSERLFVTEVEDAAEVIERLLEHRIAAGFMFGSGDRRRRVELSGTVDRIDLHADGTFRVIDYKASRAPQAGRSLQLPVYARCAEQQLAGRRDRAWRAADAAYVAFGDDRLHVSVPGGDIQRAMADGDERVLDVVESIERGDYPPRPAEIFRCTFCSYPTVCRKDYVGDD